VAAKLSSAAPMTRCSQSSRRAGEAELVAVEAANRVETVRGDGERGRADAPLRGLSADLRLSSQS
jgi:hypothetical protein